VDHRQTDEEMIMPSFVQLTPQNVLDGSINNTTLDIAGASKEPNAPAILFDANGGDNQLFELRETGEVDPNGGKFVWIIAKHSGMALTVPLEPRFDIGAQVVQQPLLTGAPGREGDVQKWLAFPGPTDGEGGPPTIIFANRWSSLVLDAKASGTGNHTPIIQFGEANTRNQLWRTFAPGVP
jgi:hypothetical protein